MIEISRNFSSSPLDHAGFITDVYSDPLSVLMNFKKGMYDLLLLDISMPLISGFELYGKISQIDDGVKVCFVTAFEEYYSEFKTAFPHLKKETSGYGQLDTNCKITAGFQIK